MTEKDHSEGVEKKQSSPRIPWWILGIGFIFPPAWPFIFIVLIARYPKTSLFVAGSTIVVAGSIAIYSYSMTDSRQKERVATEKKEEQMLPLCLQKHANSSKAKDSADDDCYYALLRDESRRIDIESSRKSSDKSNAELACRSAVKNSLPTLDGYHIPFGSVNTAPHAGYPGQYVTKFPYIVKNAFGVKVRHGVECVATGDGSVLMINQLF